MRYRVIYMIEVFLDAGTADDMLVARRYAANKRTANRIARAYRGYDVVVRKLNSNEHAYINRATIERI